MYVTMMGPAISQGGETKSAWKFLEGESSWKMVTTRNQKELSVNI
jgi:hypothetical protein